MNPPVEILWEITPECSKNCFYCGSKELTKQKPLNYDLLVKIATEIAGSKNKPKEITLTGGEPGTLPYKTLFDIVTIFRSHKIKVKSVTNGTLITKIFNENRLLIDSFDRIGLSINTKEDIHNIPTCVDKLDNITVVTNFGTHNIFMIDEIRKIVDSISNCWQIQLTEGNEYQLPPEGIDLLWKKIKDVPNAYLADNAQEGHRCQAGTHGCSITWDGLIIPCLSERAWCKHSKLKTYGNILEESFDKIWEVNLEEYRKLECKKCCRDIIKYPYERIIPEFKKIELKKDEPQEMNVAFYAIMTLPEDINPSDHMFVYGVNNPVTVVYSVRKPRNQKSSWDTKITYCVYGPDEIEN